MESNSVCPISVYNHEYNYNPNWTTRILTNLNHNYNKIWDILGTRNSEGFLIRREEKVRACDGAHCPIIMDFKIQLRDGNERGRRLKKRICVLSVFIAIIPTHLLWGT